MRKGVIIILILLLCLNAFGENTTPIAQPSPYEQNQRTILDLLTSVQGELATIKQNLTTAATPADLNATTQNLTDQINTTQKIANSKVDAGTVVIITIFVSALNWCFFFLMKSRGRA